MSRSDRPPERILLIQLQQLGDVLLTSALLQDLRAAFPAAQIDFLTRAVAARLLAGNPLPSEVVVYDSAHALRMPWRVRGRHYDWVVDPQSSPRSAQVVLASGARRRIGYAIRGPWRLVYTDRVARDLDPPGYMVRERQRLLQQAGVPVAERRPRIYLSPEERARGEQDARDACGQPGPPRVGLVLSAGSPTSVWPVERYAALAAELAAEGVVPVVIRSRGDDDAIARCRALTDAVKFADVPDLRRFLGLIAALDVLVCSDTGPAHMAMALDVPTATLYGPTHARHWNPGLPTTGAVSSPRALCVACARGLHRADSLHTCMLEIDVADVHARVRQLLAAPARPKP